MTRDKKGGKKAKQADKVNNKKSVVVEKKKRTAFGQSSIAAYVKKFYKTRKMKPNITKGEFAIQEGKIPGTTYHWFEKKFSKTDHRKRIRKSNPLLTNFTLYNLI